ncbi:MAG: queuosine precursor transporter [Sphingobacteriia bacterium]|nr:queuosine precursor transporter [Sphingobacteriia bacterium]
MPGGEAQRIQPYPKHLWFLILSYSMIIVQSNWFDVRIIRIFNMDTDAGTLVFPLTFLLSDVITEVYGYKQARRAIWCGFLFNVICIVYGQIITSFPSPEYATHNQMFDNFLILNIRIIFSSFVSYMISEPVNSFIMAKMKINFKGQHMGIRFILSTVVAALLDSGIFAVLAYYGTMSHMELFNLIITMWFIRIVIEVIGLPLSTWLAGYLKKIEHLDIYDNKTNFTIFSLDGDYSTNSNKFIEEEA